jgi:8-oxo-dGTP pyrophosphatase MutT (NUDIX family)
MGTTTTSCGVLLLNPQRELLLCHATGAAHWDIPKGVGEPGETPREAALRETFEETGLRLEPQRLLDLGRLAYRPGKDLHLFAAWSERIDPGTLVCSSQFVDRRGSLVPEADAFEWTPFERVPQRCAKNMVKVLTQTLSLEALWQRLRSDTA